MSTWLRFLCVVLIALLAGSASAGAASHGPRAGSLVVHHVVDEQANSHCGRCGVHEPVACAELCVGSLESEREADAVHLDIKDVFMAPWADNLREGLRSPPLLTPPIA